MNNHTLAEQILSRPLLRKDAPAPEVIGELIAFAKHVREGRRPPFKATDPALACLRQAFPNPNHPVWSHVPSGVALPELNHRTLVDNAERFLSKFSFSDSAREHVVRCPESFVQLLQHMLAGRCDDVHLGDHLFKGFLESNFPPDNRPWEFELK